MQDAGGDEPAGAGLQTIGLAVIEDAVVALVPAFQAGADIGFTGPWLQAEKCERKVVAGVIQLGWKKVRLRFTLLSYQGRLGVVLMHVVRNRPQVVEEFAIYRPALVLLPAVGA